MKKLKYILALVAIVPAMVLTSCDSSFEEVNTNPNDPSVVPANLLLGNALRATANQIQGIFLSGEAGSCWVQHLGKPVYNDNELYVPRQGSITDLWDQLYLRTIKNAEQMQVLAAEEENSNLQGVALVIKAHAFQVLADAFGNIPLQEALMAEATGNTTPVYDDSKSVYSDILTMLDEAMVLLNGSGTIDASQDFIYSGDYMNWKRFAASLKFRVLMRVSKDATTFNVASELQALVNSGLLFSNNEQEAKLAFLSASPNANPYFETLVDGGRVSEWCLGESLVNFMLGYNDPRLPVYAQEVGGNGSGNGYVGKPAGIQNIGDSFYGDSNNVSLIGDKYIAAEQPAFYLSYAQLEFLMAEAAEKGFISGDPAVHYVNGITASCYSNGLTGTGEIPLSYNGGASGLEQIAEQEWVALYMQGFESFTEYNRTGYPVLPLAIDAVLTSIPTRFNYPNEEQSLNNANYTQAVSEQGADLLTTPLWWQN
ncbi:SusD/RagB family nutrient-binding outer membrane lipoprotein [Formosa sp. PL04]|uniref:SusD/RagB family nutrient-binding outer membrane lipoprotein n=1 Tax=Formosa sp. PL04 TaxID=3081755 RepID=UPI002981A6AA|nr:SusD/RagB family nutrient-binding outer membrane lipoprotein [Formosa sp. PL04]MDW5287775.1 SusD/RagB family nutrient-binding outer membrane lipoprotein [Formosa sp. PL04]